MRKLIFIIIAIIVLISFTSCDALLEGFFPEFAKDEKNTELASLDLYVDVSDLLADSTYHDKKVYIFIHDMDVANKGLRLEFLLGSGNFSEVVKVPRNEFAVFAYVAIDGADDWIENFEPSDDATYWDTVNNKSMPNCDLKNKDYGNYIYVDLSLRRNAFEVTNGPSGPAVAWPVYN